LICDPRTAISE